MMRHLLGIEEMSRAEIERMLETAEAMLEVSQREIKKVPTLRGRTVINLFFESSTRTRVSFEIAGKRLSADAINVSRVGLEPVEGRDARSTRRGTSTRWSADVLVVRHTVAGVPHMLAERVRVPVDQRRRRLPRAPDAGAARRVHPAPVAGHARGLESIAIVGDIAHSRVARSDIHCFTKLGAEVRVAGAADDDARGHRGAGREAVLLARAGARGRRRGRDAAHPAGAARRRAVPVACASTRAPSGSTAAQARARQAGRDRDAPGPDQPRRRDRAATSPTPSPRVILDQVTQRRRRAHGRALPSLTRRGDKAREPSCADPGRAHARPGDRPRRARRRATRRRPDRGGRPRVSRRCPTQVIEAAGAVARARLRRPARAPARAGPGVQGRHRDRATRAAAAGGFTHGVLHGEHRTR